MKGFREVAASSEMLSSGTKDKDMGDCKCIF